MDQASKLHIWTARPKDVELAQWPQLTAWLDAAERLCAAKFRRDDDRRAYILAHALRRLAVATELGMTPASLAFSSETGGKPILTAPADRAIHFSHARSRTLVVCAVTRIGPVGIDAEFIEHNSADMALLRGLVALPDAQQRRAALGSDSTRQFFFYWTLLEAYWKSRGSGLSFDNPALHCQPTPQGWFEVSTSQAGAGRHAARSGLAWATALQGPPDCMIMLAVTPSPAVAARSALRLCYHTPLFQSLFEPVLARQDGSPRNPHPWHRPCAPPSPLSRMQAATSLGA
ncbi:MAG: 4'-phosphopantetheinyl transferase superfamily protein [Polaromonas sp.]